MGLLAYTFTKPDDNMTNNAVDIYDVQTQTRRKTYSPFGKHAEQAQQRKCSHLVTGIRPMTQYSQLPVGIGESYRFLTRIDQTNQQESGKTTANDAQFAVADRISSEQRKIGTQEYHMTSNGQQTNAIPTFKARLARWRKKYSDRLPAATHFTVLGFT